VQKGVTVRDETVVLSSLPVVAFGVKRAKELLWFGLRAAVVYGCLQQLQTAVQTESGYVGAISWDNFTAFPIR
jgi:hypothetical protein